MQPQPKDAHMHSRCRAVPLGASWGRSFHGWGRGNAAPGGAVPVPGLAGGGRERTDWCGAICVFLETWPKRPFSQNNSLLKTSDFALFAPFWRLEFRRGGGNARVGVALCDVECWPWGNVCFKYWFLKSSEFTIWKFGWFPLFLVVHAPPPAMAGVT